MRLFAACISVFFGLCFPNLVIADTAETLFFLSDDLKSAVSYYSKRTQNDGNKAFLFDNNYNKNLIMYARPENYNWQKAVENNVSYEKLLFPNTTSYGYLRRYENSKTFLKQIGPFRYEVYIDGSECFGDRCIMDENIIVAVLPNKFKIVENYSSVKGTWKRVGNTITFYSSRVKGSSITLIIDDIAPDLYINLSKDLAKYKDIEVDYEGSNVRVTVPLEGMFASGQASLQNNAKPWLDTFIERIKSAQIHELRVEGHSDNVPIRNPGQAGFQSNWELSSARASSAVRYMILAGIDPKILAAVGYADSRPIADNATTEGKTKNRRIEFTIVTVPPNFAKEEYKSQWNAF